MRNRFLIVVAIIATSGCTEPVAVQPGEGLFSALDRVGTELLDRYDVPGASIAIVRDGEVAWSGAYGMANIESERPVDAQTLFNAASISKPVTAWGVMRLVEQRRINRYRPLSNYIRDWPLPESQYSKDSVTVTRLLSHTAGLSMPSIPAFRDRDSLPSLRQILSGDYEDSVYANEGSAVEIRYEPNGHPRYSGGGYVLAQLLVEEVSDRSFSEYMVTEILRPLGMSGSQFGLDDAAETRTASPYNRRGRVQPHYYFTGTAGAGMYATATDLAHFISAAMQGQANNVPGRGVLSPATVAEMLSPVVEIPRGTPGELDATGLGYFVETDRSGDWLASHSGGNIGWRARMVLAPDAGKGIVVLTNSDNGGELIEEILCLWQTAEALDTNTLCDNRER